MNENPYEILGIEDISFQEVVWSLEQKIDELKRLRKHSENIFQSRQVMYIKPGYSLANNQKSLENYLNEKFILGLPLNSKFFDRQDYTNLLELVEEKKKLNNEEPTYIYQSIYEQSNKLSAEIRKYSKVINQYRNRPDDEEIRNAVADLYIETKFEEKVLEIVEEVAAQLPPQETIRKDEKFKSQLIRNSKYQKLQEAYWTIASEDARRDLIPEQYVKSRMLDDSGVFAIKEIDVERLLKRERVYQEQWKNSIGKSQKEKFENGEAINPNHDYSWGIVLTEPKMLIQDEIVDTPEFKGKISVENIGHFTEESLFQKRLHIKEKKKNTTISKIKTNLAKRFKFLENKFSEKNMREYFYKYEASKRLYDEMYRVTKTDLQGRVRTDIVFSPITYNDIKNKEDLAFVKNVYFSDYMLDLARQNGGYAGLIIKTPEGLSITNRYSHEEIGCAVLFDREIPGSIYDCRAEKTVKHSNKTKQDFLKMLNQEERMRSFNE